MAEEVSAQEQPGRLAENIVYFARALRAAGIPVGPGAVLDALEALRVAGIGTRDDFYWTLHAVFGLAAIVMVLGGVLTSRSGFARLMRDFAVEVQASERAGRLLRVTVYATLAFGLLVPFLPLWLSAITPPQYATWTAALAATAFAIPLFVAVGVIWRLDKLVVAALPRLTRCPRCGYPRPPGTRCSECGYDPSV